MFASSPEYEARLARPFVPPTATLKQIHDAVPKRLLQKDTTKSLFYVTRDFMLAMLMFAFAAHIEPMVKSGLYGLAPGLSPWHVILLRACLWLVYWWWQGLIFTGFFCIAHELGHGALFHSWAANDVPGFVLATFILLPYHAWKATHNAHHKAVGSIERDENYVPHLRSHYNLPPPERATTADYAEMFEETPAATLFRMFIMQALGWWFYLTVNAMGSKQYPEGTNHFSPNSPLFNDRQRRGILISDIGISVMLLALGYFAYTYGWASLVMYYLIPYMLCNHWIVMCTFLHHSDPSIPHYRKNEWTFLRGVAATVDRPLLGWVGRFFFHNVSHDHIAHHFFSSVPFYNLPEVTAAVRNVLQDDYNYDSTNSFYALYRSFTECVFVEEEGDIVFYKNAQGKVARVVDENAIALRKTEHGAKESKQ